MTAIIDRTGKKKELFPKENQYCRDAMVIAEENGYRHISIHDIENANELYDDGRWEGIEFNRLLVKDDVLYKFVEWIGEYPFIGIAVEEIGIIRR